MKAINYGIDLGTTNSLIAYYDNGKVEVYKNPVGFKETLPSCVAFRGEKILIGDKAREWIMKDPLNVFSSFKRKMGTSEKFLVHKTGDIISPVQLSSQVLKELKNFIPKEEKPSSIVITIPASFDTVQSNATKQAGIEAGFKEVVLLQEPIAASLAFFNTEMGEIPTKGKWIVYDLGGGTFDAAIISIDKGEMRVIDHQGDNFLGGVDFDHLIATEIILKKIIEQTGKEELQQKILSKSGPYEKLYYMLLFKAEEAKKELSVTATTDVDLSFEFDEDESLDLFMEIKREEVEAIIKGKIDATIEMIYDIMERNDLKKEDLDEIILIGGSTLIPYVRNTLVEKTGLKINFSADPTNAVAVGAAYYAGTKMSYLEKEISESPIAQTSKKDIKVDLAYATTTQDAEEYITGIVHNTSEAQYYRITRADGGFDTGLKPVATKIGEFVSIRQGVMNVFNFKLFDQTQTEIPGSSQILQIQHGLFSVYGQPLPEDICIEVDDLENNSTKCELIFARNSILPLKKTIYKEISRTVKQNSSDQIIINIQEGSHLTHPNANKIIGLIEINGKQLKSDLIKGSEVEIVIEISESRDIKVYANLLFTQQEFQQIFNPTEKYVSIQKLKEEIVQLKNEVDGNIARAIRDEDFEGAHSLQQELDKLDDLLNQVLRIQEDDISDVKYQLDERKRKLAKEYYSSNSNNSKLNGTIIELVNNRKTLEYWVDEYDEMPENLKQDAERLNQKEVEIMKANSYFLYKSHISAQIYLINKMIMHTPPLLVHYYHIYVSLPESEYTDPKEARRIAEKGEKALERKNYDEIRAFLNQLLRITKSIRGETMIKGTGLG